MSLGCFLLLFMCYIYTNSPACKHQNHRRLYFFIYLLSNYAPQDLNFRNSERSLHKKFVRMFHVIVLSNFNTVSVSVS
uniref:Putative secreted protein n=1 Tax=Rhipicephalus microplus TaxID=6941 RepID=A0A6M2DB79_RHIMP